MKAIYNILGFLVIGMAVQAQSVQDNISSSVGVAVQAQSDNQDSEGLVLVQSFDNASTIKNIDGDNQIDGDKVNIKSYPNPITDNVTIEITGVTVNDNIKFAVFNVNGQVVGNWTLVQSFSNGNTFRLNFENLSTGTYILKINNYSTNLNQTKLIEKF